MPSSFVCLGASPFFSVSFHNTKWLELNLKMIQITTKETVLEFLDWNIGHGPGLVQNAICYYLWNSTVSQDIITPTQANNSNIDRAMDDFKLACMLLTSFRQDIIFHTFHKRGVHCRHSWYFWGFPQILCFITLYIVSIHFIRPLILFFSISK